MGSAESICPSCGQPAETVVRRHKTLGAWVPTWVPGPCGTSDCDKNPDREPAGSPRSEHTGSTAPAPEAGPG
ncbi:hypothetical protein ACFYQA_04620 [Streptomyces sp. NPDC005774]|uniref:hypothetical protein n=1 Tax=Streptomyces sp. NPDC005774 TaxID=3364728 RepID=UPI00368A19B2